MPLSSYMEKVSKKKIKESLEGKHRDIKGILGVIITSYAALISLYHIYTAYFGPPFAVLFRNIHWMLIATLLFAIYPAYKREPQPGSLRYYLFLGWDILCIVASIILGLYLWLNWSAIASRAGAPTSTDIYLGMLLVLMVIEAGRRTVGWPIIIVSLSFIAYAYFGQSMPGLLIHRGYTIRRIFPYLYLTDAGIFGIPLGVASRFILLFIVFGAFLERCGAGIFFRDLSMALTGKYVGGPAKSAVLFSAFIGSISGSSTANVATTGTFTIPLMKKLGYKPAFAAGVEANASTGGQILPPVMGAAAFVMAEWLRVPYVTIMIAAAFPAFCFFSTSYFMIHYRAKREGLVGLPDEDLPGLKETLKQGGHNFLPLILLVIFLLLGYSPTRAVFYAIIITIPLSWIRKETRMYPMDIFQALANGAKNSVEIIAACALAGIIIGMVTMTGLGLKFSTLIEQISGGNLFIALLLTLLASILLGMGIPTTAKYIILATLVAPALVNMGAPLLAAHLFILYFGADADVTPPVGLAAYAAAGLAGAHPLAAGWEAFKIGITAYIIPIAFIYGPALILKGSFLEIVLAMITATIGAAVLGAAVQAYFVRHMPLPHRAVGIIGAILLIQVGFLYDVIGLLLVAFIFFLESRETDKSLREMVQIT